jgi:uncharacterized membrane protein YsdA (DUF1294 family)/cold shock CspA family protein
VAVRFSTGRLFSRLNPNLEPSIHIMRIEGTLKSWNDSRGFGFIEPVYGGQEIFVHIKSFEGRTSRPQVGQALSFEVEVGPQGKKRAKRVQLVAARRVAKAQRNESPVQWGTASFFAIPAFFIVYAAVAASWSVPGWVAGFYLAASALCFAVYAIDKAAALAGRWRVAESTLIALGLAGGWPGAIVAQQLLRHKSNKASFRAAFWGSVMFNVAGFITLCSPYLILFKA